MQTLKLEGEDKKIGGIYYFLPDPISVETVRNEIEKELGEKAKKPTTKNNSSPDSSSNSNEQTKKATNQNKTPTDPPPSTNAHAEWIMRNQP
ncbi:Uncharacterised protein [Streptococcus pneumoniae]|nr:Uncharacterised protein [Streptococcus pneumoniae]COQ46229.1 Uncharacterised protein [Streptococcus pneumoniae]